MQPSSVARGKEEGIKKDEWKFRGRKGGLNEEES